jgi:hypothetical protein
MCGFQNALCHVSRLVWIIVCANLCIPVLKQELLVKHATAGKLEIQPATQYDVYPVQTKINRWNKHLLSRTNINNNKPQFTLTNHH